MALRDWLDSGKCLLGLHEGEWRRDSPQSCLEIRTCTRCKTESRRTEHDWAGWGYLSARDCTLARSCQRCPEEEKRVEHQWGTWTYRRDHACEQGTPCTHCSAWANDHRIEHAWCDWEYDESYRAPIHECSRCSLLSSFFPAQRIRSIRPHEAALPSGDDTEAAPDDHETQKHTLAALRQQYEEQTRDGVITPERALLLKPILAELEDVLSRPAATLAQKQIRARRLQDAMLRLNEALLDPSRDAVLHRPAAGTRLALVADVFEAMFRYVYSETTGGMLIGEEGKLGLGLLVHMRDTREAIASLSPSGDPSKLETESLRQLALDVRNFSLRQHLTLIEPIWPTHTTAQSPHSVFYSGGDPLGKRLVRACAERNLAMLIPQPTGEPAALRWNQMREAALAIFDFTSLKPNATPKVASAAATVAYELGIALVLGRPVIIAALDKQQLPFDLDIEPVRLESIQDPNQALELALDHNLYGLQRGQAGSSVARSMHFLRARFKDCADVHTRQALGSIDDDVIQDPVATRLLIASMLGFVGAGAPQIAFPTWPGGYSNPETQRCFHVTPFGPSWADSTSRAVKKACGAHVSYVRGDQVLMPDIIRSIWDEISCANYIVVDLTGLNANVALELGMAHTIGRKVMLISQDQHAEKYFRAIAKQRVHHYTIGDDGSMYGLEASLTAFVNEPTRPV